MADMKLPSFQRPNRRASVVKVEAEVPADTGEVRIADEAPVVPSVSKTKALPSAEQLARRSRRSRSPIDGRRNVLTVKGLSPGMIGRWVENTPDRVEDLMDQGYETVRHPVQIGDRSIDLGAPMGSVVTKRAGGGRELILMQIPKEWYEADQREKQAVVDEREVATKAGTDTKNFYGEVTSEDVVPGKRPKRRDGEES